MNLERQTAINSDREKTSH